MPSENIHSNDPVEDPYAPSAWGQPTTFDFVCPSGQRCLLRKMDPVMMIADGMLEKMDFLSSVVSGKHIPNAKKTAVQRAKEAKAKVGTADMTPAEKKAAEVDERWDEIFKDPEKMKDFTITIDRVVTKVIVKPEVQIQPAFESEMVEGVVYANTIDFNDKVAIFNAAMKGVSGLESFRGGSEESVEPVAGGTDVPSTPKRAPRRKR